MLFASAQVLLYTSQLVYVSDKWVRLTRQLLEEAQIARLRLSVDWKQPATKLRK